MNSHLRRKGLFIISFVLVFFIWLYISGGNRPISNLGITGFTIAGYLVTLAWMRKTYQQVEAKQRYFWLFFSLGTSFLLISKIVSVYFEVKVGVMPHSPIEDSIRLIGYLCFFIGLSYQMKLFRDTLPMLRFVFNILIVIISVFSVSWYQLVNPMLAGNHEITHVGIILSSIYHVLNISLLFAAVCLIFFAPSSQNKTSLYLIAAGFFIQVIGDYLYMNHVQHIGNWLFLLWPLSALLMGLGAVFAKEYPWSLNKEDEKLQDKRFHFSFFTVVILIIFTFYNQLHETNMLEKGLHLTVVLLLFQQIFTAIENKNIFTKLKQLAYPDGHFQPDGKTKNGEMEKLLQKIENLAHYDPLTKLPNRHLFQIRLEQELKRAEKYGDKFSLMYIDMDRFKYVNDSLGHDCGDLLLKEVASRLKLAVNQTAMVARIGGDEFAIILPESDQNDLIVTANHILQKFEASFTIKGNELYSTPSIGISIYPEGGRTEADLLKSADAAMYLAKEEGKNKFRFFDPYLNETITKKIQLEWRLRKAMEEGHLHLFYQPQVDLRTDKVIGLEALIRWLDPELGTIGPDEFIPIAEETGLIEPIGLWVLETACRQLKEWQSLGMKDVTMAVNASIRQFQNPRFVDDVKRIVEDIEIDPQYLKLEITESILQDLTKTLKSLNDLRAFGIQIAVDDFGTGYSSLSYLKNMPVNYLKIDKSFIDELSMNADGPIVKTIIDMGRNLNFTVIAEGVESEEHVSFLRKNNCFVGQGYFFSKPLPADKLEPLLLEESAKIY